MLHTNAYKNKKVLVVGLARSGVACANLLVKLGAREVCVTDNKDSEATRSFAKQLSTGEIRVELGTHSRALLEGKDMVIVSPGIPRNADPILWAQELSIPVISEIEFAWSLCPATVIAVTGSNGKTTTTTLIAEIIRSSGRNVFVCGNIGTPFAQEVEKMKKEDFVSLEISSFQLEHIRSFKPHIAVILNFSPNHLDRHKDMQEYLDAKKRIFMNQGRGDYTVLNADDPMVKSLSSETKAKTVFFSGEEKLNPDYAATAAVGSILGLKKDLVLKVLADFKGIEHRMEYVAEIRGVKFINDSKATTVESALWALRNTQGPVVLIAGGRHKGIDYKTIVPLAKTKVRQAILIGEARPIMKKAFLGEINFEEADTLEDAVRKAFASARPGDYVVLSPMCSSFDMFSSYEHRGKVFKEIVIALAGELHR
jgi:UDP-N-acetylmuramoylalanine--D-glutamate ligase